MQDVVIVDAVRTPVGNHGGMLRKFDAVALSQIVINGLLKRTKIDPATIAEVIWGCVFQSSDAPNIARVAALKAGIPKEVPAYTVARNCDSGMDAIVNAWRGIQVGDGDIYLVGGVESMSNIPYLVRGARWGLKLRHSEMTDALWEGLTDPNCGQIMGRTAENLVEEYDLTREQQDEYAVQSHKKALQAQSEKKFDDEIIIIEITKKNKENVLIRQDETINPGLTMEKASYAPTVFKEDGTVTPVNACSISDGASAMLIMTAEKANQLGYTPLARIISYGYAGVEPHRMGIAPVGAVPKALEKADLELGQLDLIEINEAFAGQVLAVGKELSWDWDRVNVNGGAIALGHPVGSSGCRIVVTLLHEMKRRNKNGVSSKYGLATLCAEGGQGSALIVEALH
ncbi:MAG: thiolase family protein [Anaerolineales bacterium]|uniref:acetyl-CoA C-acetyltransferase n=1 Tax=Candidatus Desulfolinea nitratireducens TaxID=2841698 RepID=A0A8J6NMJ0_9CHLR|nr:thiolase family protein [Candidatus Desulfolinea nitratireducens]MBL6961326.1 thiolase family protein [Anaerolineales bacterium]